MTKPTETLVEFPRQSAQDVLTEVLRTGAQQLLATRRSRPRSTSMLRLGRRRLTRPVGAEWSATATCPNGRCKPRSGTSPCSSRGFGTAGQPTNGKRSGRRPCRRTGKLRPVAATQKPNKAGRFPSGPP